MLSCEQCDNRYVAKVFFHEQFPIYGIPLNHFKIAFVHVATYV